jgi:hypothetical protein
MIYETLTPRRFSLSRGLFSIPKIFSGAPAAVRVHVALFCVSCRPRNARGGGVEGEDEEESEDQGEGKREDDDEGEK